jgi:Cu-Zn family superoxide dismutase
MRLPLLALAACVTLGAAAQAQPADQAKTVRMSDARGSSVGTVEVRQVAHGTLFVIDLRNLPPGAHGFHLHERGVCEAPGFQSAGGHYNPGNRAHGADNANGPHAGDLPNIRVTQQGTAAAEMHSSLVSLDANPSRAGGSGPHTLLDADGTAIMIHQQADDYRDMDSAGSRIACGVLKAPD